MTFAPNPNKLNLITPMSMVAYIASGEDPGVYEADHTWTPFGRPEPNASITLTGLERATSDVRVTLWVRADLGDPFAAVFMAVNGETVGPFLGLWREEGEHCALYPYSTPTVLTIPEEDWNRWVDTEQGPGEARVVFTPNNFVHEADCPGSFLQLHLEFTLAPVDTGVPRPPQAAITSLRKTMVAGKWEPRGIPHRHPAEFVFDRRNGCLAIRQESHFWGDDVPKVCYSGGGVSPAEETETRPGGGVFESRCIGELGGVPVRFVTGQACLQV